MAPTPTEESLSRSATYLKVIQWTTAGKLKPVLLKPQEELAAENIDETTKISQLEIRAKQTAELLDKVKAAVDGKKKEPIPEDEDPNSNNREDIFAEVTERVDAARRHVDGLARSINETGIQNEKSRNTLRDKIKKLDKELDEIIVAGAKKTPNLAEAGIKEQDLLRLLMLKPRPQAKAIDDLVQALDPANKLGIESGLKSFVKGAMSDEVQKIVEAKLELVAVQKKRLSQLAGNVEKSEEDMSKIDREVDALAQTIKQKLASIVSVVPALNNRIRPTDQTRMQMS